MGWRAEIARDKEERAEVRATRAAMTPVERFPFMARSNFILAIAIFSYWCSPPRGRCGRSSTASTVGRTQLDAKPCQSVMPSISA
jgi:hypothetical protein